MPLEGHWKRTNTPLRRLTRRERRVAIASAVVVLVTVLALVLATVGDSRPGPKAGCIYAIVPSMMLLQALAPDGAVVPGQGVEAVAVFCNHCGLIRLHAVTVLVQD